MRTFGSYEATREIARTAFGQVWRARSIGEQDERFVVKTIDCGELSFVADDAIVSGRLDAFLDGAKAQGSFGDGWVRVHQSGRLSDSAYVVMDAMPLSIARLVEGRSAISGHVLVAMTTGICSALRSARDGAKRWHGNLKGTNVFFDRDTDLNEAKVVLSDPAASKEIGADKGEVADLHAIGELIYQLVVHRAFKALGGWPVPPGKEWDRLGKVGSGWRELCSELLNPDLKPGQITLEQIAERAVALTPPPRPVLRYVFAAVALVAITVGGLLAWQNRPWKPLEWNQPLWTEVCDNSEWYAMLIEGAIAGDADTAFAEFRGKVLISGSEREGLLALTPDLNEIDSELAEAVRSHLEAYQSKDIDAAAWARFTERYPDVVVEGGVERAVSDLSKDKSRQPWVIGDARRFTTALGSKVMYQTANFAEFREQSPDGGEDSVSKASYGLYFARFMQLELQARIESQIQSLRERVAAEGGAGVPAPRASDEIRLALERGALWEESSVSTADRLRALAGVGRDASRLQSGWKSVSDAAAQLSGSPGSSDAVVGALLASATRAVSATDSTGGLADVLATIDGWGAALKEAATVVAAHGEREIDWRALPARESLASAYAAAEADTLDGELFGQWVAGLKDDGYWLVTDPRPTFTASGELESAQRVLASIDSIEREVSEAEIGSVEAEISAIRERVARAEALPWIRRNRETVLAEAGATRTDAERAHDSARDLVANITTSAAEQIQRWMAEDPGTLTSVAAIRDKWASTRQALSIRLDPSVGATPSQLRAALRNARRVLLWDEDARTNTPTTDGWAKKLEAWGAAAPETRPVAWDDGAWSNAVQAQRESMARTLIKSLDGWDFGSRLERWSEHDAVQSTEDRVWEEAEAWTLRTTEMASDFARIEMLRDRWYGYEETPADSGDTIRAIMDRWGASQEMSEALRSVAIVASDAQRLRTIPAMARVEAAALAPSASEPAWSRFAAWRALGAGASTAPWPGNASELSTEIAIRTGLRTQAGLMSDVDRKQSISDEIASSGPVRWSVAALRGGASDLSEVMRSREAMGVRADSPGLDPRAAVNIALFDFVEGVRGVEEDAAKSMASAVVSRTRSLLPSTGGSASLEDALGKIDSTLSGGVNRKTLDVILHENGPGKHESFSRRSIRGGDEYSAPDAITYANKQGFELEFVRVNDSETEPVYLCTEEISIAQAAALLGVYPGSMRRAGRTWYQLEAQSAPGGVITWEVKGSRLVPFAATQSGWWSVDNVGAAEAFPTGMTPPGPPTAETPIQWIEPLMIEGLAGTIGCRLPTSAEWRMALARERAAGGGSVGANLRDATFSAFTAHVAQLRERSTVRSLEYPHRDSYDPGDLKGAAVSEGATTDNDGSLWFETPSHPNRGRVFRHLVGNVAEFVHDSPDEKSGYGIIGGSAMSASRDFEAVTPAKSQSAFSDVGGRLAFSLRDLQPPMWAALLQNLGDPVPYFFVSGSGD